MTKYSFCPRCGRPFLVGDIIVDRVKRRWTALILGIMYSTEHVHLDCDKAKSSVFQRQTGE